MRAIQITEFGGPEVLVLRELDDPEPPEGFVVLDVLAAGVNWADTHQAENSYLAAAELPLVPGGEVVGTTPEGKRVVALLNGGGYAERAIAHPSLMWEVPNGVSDAQALAVVLQGASAWHLLRTSAQLREGESVAVFAAAGGVGTIAVQLAKRFGAGRIIGLASSPEKRELATRLGADATVDSNADNLKEALIEANEGRHLDVILEMVGGDYLARDMTALAFGGRVAIIALKQGSKPAFDFSVFQRKDARMMGSRLRPRPIAEKARLVAAVRKAVWPLIEDGKVKPVIDRTFAFKDVAQAHAYLESGAHVGKVLLTMT